MEFNEYQRIARTTAVYKEPKIIYTALGLAGESGECCEKIKKMLRDDNGILTDIRRSDLIKELGDCLWYLSNLAADINVELETIANTNLDKLLDRKARGVIHGSGDNR
jgi:NTP pyrophosphatase (non-canonical NTP hydrolase)